MKEPSAPQVTYDGSLKELAKAHLGLVSACLYMFIIPIPMLLVGLWMEVTRSIPSSPGREICEWVFLAACAVGYSLLFYSSLRLIRLLFPYIWVTLAGVAFVPFSTLPLAIILWVCALRQLRARGLRAGVFGVNPALIKE